MLRSILTTSPIPYRSRRYSTPDKDSAYATCACKSEKRVNEPSSAEKGIAFRSWNRAERRDAYELELRGSISSAMPSLSHVGQRPPVRERRNECVSSCLRMRSSCAFMAVIPPIGMRSLPSLIAPAQDG